MSVIEYSLFRIKFVKTPQYDLFNTNYLTPRDFFLLSITEKPSAQLQNGYKWHIGNIEKFSGSTGYFAIGRSTITNVSKFDEITGNFLKIEAEESAYTHCIFNAELGFVGIAKDTNLTAVDSVAKQLEKLLSSSSIICENKIRVEIHPIRDPQNFLNQIISASRVLRFTVTFGLPNPFDADEYLQKPLSVYLSASEGESGRTEIQGKKLNKEIIKEVTRSTVATGNEASARIECLDKKQKTIHLKGDSVKRTYDGEHNPLFVLDDLTDLYHQIRSDGRNQS